MLDKKMHKNADNFICEKCDFICYRKSNYNIHLATAKHKMLEDAGQKMPKNALPYECECGKKYKHNQSYYRHKKTCCYENKEIILTTHENIPTDCNFTILNLLSQNKELMNLLVIQNKEHREETSKLQNTIQELVPKIGNNNTINNTTNNTQFNLQVFLNEDCKDAINFSDFIKQIQVSLTDLENQAENGYIKGITKLFIESLQGLGMNNRPIHCTDKKRKTLYIKENNEWDKEGSQDILKKGIQEVTRRTFERLIKEQKIHSEEYNDADSEFSMKCISIQRNLTPNHPRDTTISKVIDNITQNTGILEKI